LTSLAQEKANDVGRVVHDGVVHEFLTSVNVPKPQGATVGGAGDHVRTLHVAGEVHDLRLMAEQSLLQFFLLDVKYLQCALVGRVGVEEERAFARNVRHQLDAAQVVLKV